VASGSVRVQVGKDAVASFAQLAWDLRRAGAKSLRVELQKGLQRASRPLVGAVKANARATLPTGGGRGKRRSRLVSTGETLTNQVSGRTHAVKRRRISAGPLAKGESVADRVEGATYQVRVTGGLGGPRLRVVAVEKRGKRIDLYRLNEGVLRAPLFGNRRFWHQQSVPPGWFEKPIRAHEDEFRRQLEAAVGRVVDEINGG
jgi:hypothetical protein